MKSNMTKQKIDDSSLAHREALSVQAERQGSY